MARSGEKPSSAVACQSGSGGRGIRNRVVRRNAGLLSVPLISTQGEAPGVRPPYVVLHWSPLRCPPTIGLVTARGSREPESSSLRKAVMGFWFAVQRLARRGDDPTAAEAHPPRDDRPDDDDDRLSGSGMPRRPAPSSGSASAAVPEPSEDPSS